MTMTVHQCLYPVSEGREQEGGGGGGKDRQTDRQTTGTKDKSGLESFPYKIIQKDQITRRVSGDVCMGGGGDGQ